MGPVEGTVIESNQEQGLGKMATVLVKRGTLKKGQYLVCGETYAHVRNVLDTRAPISDQTSHRVELKSVRPAEACRISGWKDIPHAGNVVMEVESEKRAKEVIEWREDQRKLVEEKELAAIIEDKRKADRQVYDEFRLENIKTNRMYWSVYGRGCSKALEVIREREKSA